MCAYLILVSHRMFPLMAIRYSGVPWSCLAQPGDFCFADFTSPMKKLKEDGGTMPVEAKHDGETGEAFCM